MAGKSNKGNAGKGKGTQEAIEPQESTQEPDNQATTDTEISAAVESMTPQDAQGNPIEDQDEDNQEPDTGDDEDQGTEIAPGVMVSQADKDNPILAPLIQMITTQTQTIGGQEDKLIELDSRLTALNKERDAIGEQIKQIRGAIGAPQAERNKLIAMLRTYQTPATLIKPSKGSATTGGAVNREPSQEVVNRALSLLRKLPQEFTNEDYAVTKGCGSATAGGDIKRYRDTGIITQIRPGLHKIADKYQGQ
jgi:hypothetical protein